MCPKSCFSKLQRQTWPQILWFSFTRDSNIEGISYLCEINKKKAECCSLEYRLERAVRTPTGTQTELSNSLMLIPFPCILHALCPDVPLCAWLAGMSRKRWVGPWDLTSVQVSHHACQISRPEVSGAETESSSATYKWCHLGFSISSSIKWGK